MNHNKCLSLILAVLMLISMLSIGVTALDTANNDTTSDASFISYQVTKGEDGVFSLRILAGINSLEYKSFGYEITVTDKTGTREFSGVDTHVYSAIYGGDTLYSIKDEFGFEYAAIATVKNLSTYSFDTELEIRTYVVSEENEKLYGTGKTLYYAGKTNNQGYPAIEFTKTVVEDTEVFTKMQSVLLLGQSNMSGRGKAEYVEPISDDRIYMLRDGEWVKMEEPIHYESESAEIGLAASFAKAFVETFDCDLGLIPAAVGGSGITRWKKDYSGDQEHCYATAVERAKEAQKTSEICAILWHQGETNRNSTTYDAHLKEVLDAMIEDLGLDKNKLVIITGELGAWFNETKGEPYQVDLVNNALASIKNEGYYPNYSVASQEGLTNTEGERNQGSNHYDSPSLRVFGYRYFEEFYEELMGRECTYEYSQDPNDYRIDPSA